jgi:hypothetical protein
LIYIINIDDKCMSVSCEVGLQAEMTMVTPGTRNALETLWLALGGGLGALDLVEEHGEGSLPSCFAVSDLASASLGAAGLALAEWCDVNGAVKRDIRINRRLASAWFSMTIQPLGWSLPPVWDAIAGDYRTADGWIRLHTNAPHHRAAALAVLGVAPERERVAGVVAGWQAEALETAIVEAGGCAARMRRREEWLAHPQGSAVIREPLVMQEVAEGSPAVANTRFDPARPLAGIRVLDLTRVLAGPTATRFLAGFGADVLRIDPPEWDEASVVPEVTLGKRCAHLDLRNAEDRAIFRTLLAEADILVSGYRADALEHLGFGAMERRVIRPGLIDVNLNAYGWTGPWVERRGFDSLVQMSAGIAARGMAVAGAEKPVPLPVQALDNATGYILAAAALRGLTERKRSGRGSRWRTSLARVAEFLTTLPVVDPEQPIAPVSDADFSTVTEDTVWGPAMRLKPPLAVAGAAMAWDYPAGPLGAVKPEWLR